MKEKARTVSPRIWQGETGRLLREHGADAQRLYFYLRTSPSSESIGLYALSPTTVQRDLGMAAEVVISTLTALGDAGLAFFDAHHQVVFIPDMLRDTYGRGLKASDNRCKGIWKRVEPYWHSPLAELFEAKYGQAFHCPRPTNRKRKPRKPRPPVPELELTEAQKFQAQVEAELEASDWPQQEGFLFPTGEPEPEPEPEIVVPKITPADVVEYWNASKTKIKARLTDGHAVKLRTRLKDADWPWREAIDRLPVPSTEKFTWQPDIAWLIANGENADKLAGGKYHQQNGRMDSRHETNGEVKGWG